MVSSTTVLARSEPTQTSAPAQHTDSSFFTFLIALLILVFASGALVLRALLLRRRFRTRVQAAIDAGFLPSQPNLHHKPKLYEVCIRAASSVLDWQSLMPVCATKVSEPQHAKTKPAPDTPSRVAYHPLFAGRLLELLGHPSRPNLTPVAEQPAASEDMISKDSTVQVTVLIVMPMEHSSIPPSEPTLSSVSPKGKRRDTFIGEDVLPDVVFGVSNFTLSSDLHLSDF